MKRLLIVMMLLAGIQGASAQYYRTDTASKGFDRSRVIIGGSLGFAFGDYSFGNLSPLIGYRFSNLFAAGVNINLQFAGQKYRDLDGRLMERDNYTIFGGGIFGRFYPFEQFFIHAQPEYNRITNKYTSYYDDNRQSVKTRYSAPSLLLGGGYAQPVGGSSAITLMILYDVLQDRNSPYMNRPIISGGVNIGL